MTTPNDRYTERQIAAARLYAKADRSDPFAFARAVTHIRAGLTVTADRVPVYVATPTKTKRTLPEGSRPFADGSRDWDVTTYTSVKRL